MQRLLQDLIPPAWVMITGYRLTRLQRRIEIVVVTPGAVLVFASSRAAAEAGATDLADFHEGCRGVPVIPVAMLQGERVVAQMPLPLTGAAPAIACTRLLLPGLLAHIASFAAIAGHDPAAWHSAAYRPVPALLDAACRLYAAHDEARLLLATSGRGDLARTRQAVTQAIDGARERGERLAVFVTGAPGSGKTLCGLDVAFAPGGGAAFLTGNPALVHVLRAALVRDAASRGLTIRAAKQRIEGVVQPLHSFRDHAMTTDGPPPERVLVIDEAQRCWTAAYATRKTVNKPLPLRESEPGIVLDAMARHTGWCAVVCLIGTGQEIHAGEGGLAGWRAALAARPAWHVAAPNSNHEASNDDLARPATIDTALHLGQAVRAYRAPRLVQWVEALLANDPAQARAIAGPDLPVWITRSLPALRSALRASSRKRVGLVASAGGKRLRAEGLGGLLWHQDEDAVARWFLDAWPDIRSADALEVAGTEFGVQGLELDRVGVCWDSDLARTLNGQSWEARAFRGSAWTLPRAPEVLANKLNAYRVLLTRARQATIIWVPEGDKRDTTRDPGRYDAVADYLAACGARTLDRDMMDHQDISAAESALL